MSKIQVQITVSEHAHKLAGSLVTLTKNIKGSLDDGFQAGTDVPAIVTASFPVVVDAITNMREIGPEASEDLQAFINAWMLAGTEIAGLFIKKPVAPVAA